MNRIHTSQYPSSSRPGQSLSKRIGNRAPFFPANRILPFQAVSGLSNLLTKTLSLLVALLALAGCGRDPLDTRYAAYQGLSINGVRVFADILRERGRDVVVAAALSPRIAEDVQSIVVFQSQFGRLSDEARGFLEEFLDSDPSKSVVLVLRDFDASVPYWEAMLERPEVKNDKAAAEAVAQAHNRANSHFLVRTNVSVDLNDGVWYGLDEKTSPTVRRSSRIDDPWNLLADFDGGRADLHFRRRLLLPENAERIWSSGDDTLLAEINGYYGDLFVVANGSFLLNGALVNPEHRKLAIALTSLLGNARKVALVRSDRFYQKDSEQGLLRLLTTYPNPWVLGHLAALLLLFCWYRFPIFGRPRETETAEPRRFGRHVEALGDLLARAGRIHAADERLRASSGSLRLAKPSKENV